MSLRAVIFDRDGVLTRFDFASVETLLAAVAPGRFSELWERWHAYYGSTELPRSPDEEQPYLERFWDSVCTAWSLDDDSRRRLHAFDYRQTIHPFSDARPTLAAARAKGLRVGVLSNFPLVGLEASLVSTGLRDLVDVAQAATVLGKPKPHPDAYHQMCDALGVAPSECLLVDDESPCVEGARAVGIDAYLLDRSATAPADGVVSDLHAFARLL